MHWLDPLKALALVWIFINHIAEVVFGAPYIGNPTGDWPPLAERIAQLQPLAHLGAATWLLNLVRWIGWAGDQGVQIFLIASGFGLTWGLLARGVTSIPLARFYQRRLWRIYPPWIAAHLMVGGLALLTGLGDVGVRELALSVIGWRFTPSMFYAITPAWWFIGLLIQLYLVYPWLWRVLRRWGAGRFLLVACLVGFVARALGLYLFDDYLDAWQRGAVFLTRLPEFALGMALAVRLFERRQLNTARGSSGEIAVALAAFLLGNGLALTLWGMTCALFLSGYGAFVLLERLLARRNRRGWGMRALAWIGKHSYTLYLVHHPLITLLVPEHQPAAARTWLNVVLAAALAVLAALVLEWLVAAPALVRRAVVRLGPVRGGGVGAGLVAVLLAAAGGTEATIRHADPQEVLGWGERRALAASDQFGWCLKPGRQTRLRWESYDYLVQANELGFPGPQYAEARSAGSVRIMAVGDAFTSAEGVDTAEAWPRKLERTLAVQLPGQTVEVLNFAITGHGPNQYAAVVAEFVPRFKPDLVLVGLFVNDFDDVLRSDQWFRRSIGFGDSDPDGVLSWLSLAHTRRWLTLHLQRLRDERLRGVPYEHGYFLANLEALERANTTLAREGRRRVTERMADIKRVADAHGARVVILLIPAPVQVCTADDLEYHPQHVDIHDAERFDLDQPQRVAGEICGELAVTCYDLRPVLRGVTSDCPYQARNMHWTVAGHDAVATAVAGQIPNWWPKAAASAP